MRIEDLRTENISGRARVAATVVWEDCDRPTHEVYFETDEKFSGSLTCNPHAFLVGNIVPAMHFGEQRVRIDAEICPELWEGLGIATSVLRQWYYNPGCGQVRIEAARASGIPEQQPKRAGIFFSGGIDSFAALRANTLQFPPEHPRAIRDGILVFGLEQDDPALFAHVLDSLSRVADAAGISLVPVYTNLYLNYRQEDAADRFRFWGQEFGGAALAAVAHALARRFSSVAIAATYGTYNVEPWGSHPLLDPNFSSRDLRILHSGIELTRFEKVRLVAGWDAALEGIRVCNRYRNYRPDMLNCGQCEKCVRTMLALEALGALKKTRAFPSQDISPELVRQGADIQDDPVFLGPIYREMLDPLAAAGRHDLVRAVEDRLRQGNRSRWKERVVRFDRQYLARGLVRLKRFCASAKDREANGAARPAARP